MNQQSIRDLFKSIALSGVDRSKPEQFNAIKITNLLSIVAFCVVFLQLPLQVLFQTEYTINQVIVIFAHLVLFTLIPQINKMGHYSSARICLVLVFSSYIGLTSFNYMFMTHIHYFYLIALFTVPSLHFDLKHKEVILMMAYFLMLFLIWETFLVPKDLSSVPELVLSDINLSSIAQTDKVSFSVSCFFVAYLVFSSLQSSWLKIRQAQTHSEQLLLNILPEQIARRLEKKEKPIADYFDSVSILFADIVGFSTLSQSFSPEQLVTMLNDLFTRFDALSKKYGLEKIKTVGDQYMTVAGLPEKDEKHAINICRCAIHMKREFDAWTEEHRIDSSLRIGIHSGPVVAGVIGIHKFTYDLWGDSVNLASRMESHGQSGKIQLSQATYELVNRQFMVEYKDTIEVKGMGRQNVYLLLEPMQIQKINAKTTN